MKRTAKLLKDKHLPHSIESIFDQPGTPKKKAADKDKSPNFYFKVYQIVEQIPLGKVTTYGAIAELLGMKGSARMVGQALGALPQDSDVPAQRVINRIGALSGAHHFGGYDRMRSLLKKEGVTFKEELVDMDAHFWNPASAIKSRPKNQSKKFRKPL